MIIPATPSNPSSVSVRETHQFIVRSFGHRCPSENPHGIFPIPTHYMFFEGRDAETQKTPCWPRIQLRLFSIRGIPVNSRAIVSDVFFFFFFPTSWMKENTIRKPTIRTTTSKNDIHRNWAELAIFRFFFVWVSPFSGVGKCPI